MCRLICLFYIFFSLCLIHVTPYEHTEDDIDNVVKRTREKFENSRVILLHVFFFSFIFYSYFFPLKQFASMFMNSIKPRKRKGCCDLDIFCFMEGDPCRMRKKRSTDQIQRDLNKLRIINNIIDKFDESENEQHRTRNEKS